MSSSINEKDIETDNEINVENFNTNEEKQEPMEKPKKPRTQKQLDSLKLAQEKRKENIARRKQEKQQQKPTSKPKPQPKPQPVIETIYEEEETEEEPTIIKKKKPRKKTKNKIVIEEDSSDSEQEIVISRRRRGKNKPRHDVSGSNASLAPVKNVEEPEIDEPMEKPKKQQEIEPIEEPIQYTREEILRAYGF